MIQSFRQGYHFIRQNDLLTVWNAFIHRDAHPLLQFVKYGICGVLALIVQVTVFGLLSYTIIPAHPDSVVDGQVIAKTQLAWNFVLAQTLAFLAADVTAYLTNLWIVFHGGRHHRILEFFLFTAVASIGFGIGLVISVLQLTQGLGESWAATGTLVVTSALVNYASRKFFIFKR